MSMKKHPYLSEITAKFHSGETEEVLQEVIFRQRYADKKTQAEEQMKLVPACFVAINQVLNDRANADIAAQSKPARKR